MQNFFVGIAKEKKINNIFLVNSNKISIDPYLNEIFCWANQIFVDSTKKFSGYEVYQIWANQGQEKVKRTLGHFVI